MTARRRFTGEFKAKVALEALRGDKTIQEIAARHKVHPNQVRAWKQRAVEGMKEVFTKGASAPASSAAACTGTSTAPTPSSPSVAPSSPTASMTSGNAAPMGI